MPVYDIQQNREGTYTAERIGALTEARAQVLDAACTEQFEHITLQFRYGCRFVKNFCEAYGLFQSHEDRMLTDEAVGFWPWWRLKWAMDDAHLIQAGAFTSDTEYPVTKRMMVGCTLLQKEWYYTVTAKL